MSLWVILSIEQKQNKVKLALRVLELAETEALNGINSYAYRLVVPAVVISLIVLSLNLLGDGLRDAFDPKLNT